MSRTFTLAVVTLQFALPACAVTWQVGPGHTYTAPSQVSTLVNNGDTVDIAAGIYPNDVARWTAHDLVLRGVGGTAHLESNGLSFGGKAIWVIQGDRCTVEHIEFSECAVPDANGAGIRLEGRGLTVRHCYFHHNENGILCGELHPSTVRIEYSEFAQNGHGDGYSHNLYIGAIDTLIFRFNYSHHTAVGHELKSRAWVNVIEYNRFSNEADGTASREVDLPNGGQAYLIGNVIQQGPESENSNLVGFGMEGLNSPGPHELYAIHNSLVNERTNGSFFQLPGNAYFKAYNNVLAGGGAFTSSWPTDMDTLANVRRTDLLAFGFADVTAYNYRIDAGSPAQGAGYPAGIAHSGYPLVALYEYVHPTGKVDRCQHATLDAGAFETCSTTVIQELAHAPFLVHPVPFSDVVTATIPPNMDHIVLMDPLGRVLNVWDIQGIETVQLDLSHLSPAAYLLRVQGTIAAYTQRIIRE